MRNIFLTLRKYLPVEIMLLHFRRSQVLLLFWIIIFGLTVGGWGASIGLPYLILHPEYLGEVSFLSYLMLGLGYGLFVMSFHITSYLYLSYRLPFVAAFSRPIYRFSINNSLIPILYFITFSVACFRFQTLQEGISVANAFIHLLGFYLGAAIMVSFVLGFFFSANRNLANRITAQLKQPLSLIVRKKRKSETPVDDAPIVQYYFKDFITLRPLRDVSHYPTDLLKGLLQKHYLHASFFFVSIFLIMLLMGVFRETAAVIMPAGASIFILISLYILFIGVLFSWTRGWFISVLAAIALLLNFLTTIPFFQASHPAYGMDYSTKAAYNFDRLMAITHPDTVKKDFDQEIDRLKKWKGGKKKKPVLVLLNTSGGGLRAALFTFRMLQELEMSTDQKFFENTVLMTGASGGLMGAALFRELMVLSENKKLPLWSDSLWTERVSRDLLNATAFTLVVSDLFISFNKAEINGRSYSKDRGFAFEWILNRNTENLVNQPLNYYEAFEKSGLIPRLVLSPTILNDGRRLIISPLPSSYFSLANDDHTDPEHHDAIEYMRFFAAQDPGSLRFTTALRMSATFPFITPPIELPSEPMMSVIDAGARDNNGFELSLRYLYTFREWIGENYEKVVIVQINSDRAREITIAPIDDLSLVQKLTEPIGGVVRSFANMQEFQHAWFKNQFSDWAEFDIEIVRFQLLEQTEDVALSWHLTKQEKMYVEKSISNPRNKLEILRIQELFREVK